MGKSRNPKNLIKQREKVTFVMWEGEGISVFPSSEYLLSDSIKEADRSAEYLFLGSAFAITRLTIKVG